MNKNELDGLQSAKLRFSLLLKMLKFPAVDKFKN